MSQIQNSVEEHQLGVGNQMPLLSQPMLIAIAFIIVLIASTSGLAYHSPFAPLVIAGGVAAAVLLVLWVQRPVWALFAAIFVLLLPLGLIPAQYQSLLNRSLTMFALATWLLSLIVKKHYVIIYTPSLLAMAGFLVWSLITLAWTVNLSNSLNTVQMYALRFILFILLMINEIRNKETLNNLTKVIALSGWITIAVSMFVTFTQGYTSGSRLQVLNINQNDLGVILLVVTPAVLWQAMQPSRRYRLLRKLMGMLYLLLCMALIALSGSRGSAISLFITLVAFWLWKPTRPWANFVLLLGIITAPFLFATTLGRFAIQPGDTLLGHREPLWAAGWLLFTQHPLTGIGIGTSTQAVPPYIRQFVSLFTLSGTALHNPVLTILVETGIIGLLFYLAVPLFAIWSFISQYLRAKRQGERAVLPYFALVGSVFLGYMASWIKGGGMETDYTYFLILALLLIPSSLLREEQVK